MNIGFVCNEYPPYARSGGIGTYTRMMAEALIRAGHRVHVVGFASSSLTRTDNGVRVMVFRQWRIPRIGWYLNRRRLYHLLRHSVRTGLADIVEVPDFQGLLPFKVPFCPVVVRLHLSATLAARDTGGLPRKSVRWLEGQTLSAHRSWTAPSEYVLRETAKEFGITADRAAVIPYPVALPEEDKCIPNGLPGNFVLYAGTVSDRKGAYVLAEASRAFLRKFPDLHLVYAGFLDCDDERPENRILSMVGHDLAPRVHLTGYLERQGVLSLMRRARLLALPSKCEGLPIVVLEAMACGTPVVYSRVGVGPELVEDGVTGLLADPHSSDDVAEKVLAILENPDLALKLGRNGKRKASECFSLDKCMKQTVRFYEQCMADWSR